MRKLGLSLASASVAAVFALAAQAAHAGTLACPTGGGDGEVMQEEVGGEPCPGPIGGWAPVDLTAVTADNVPVEVNSVIEGGDDILPPGTITEVDIDLDDVTAYLKLNEDEALALAAAQGIKPSDVSKAGLSGSAKLSFAEVKVVAENVLATMQSRRTTGRSDPAGQNTTRRESWIQATGRAIGSAFRGAFGLNARGSREVTIYPDGRRVYRTEVQIEVNPQDGSNPQ